MRVITDAASARITKHPEDSWYITLRIESSKRTCLQKVSTNTVEMVKNTTNTVMSPHTLIWKTDLIPR